MHKHQFYTRAIYFQPLPCPRLASRLLHLARSFHPYLHSVSSYESSSTLLRVGERSRCELHDITEKDLGLFALRRYPLALQG